MKQPNPSIQIHLASPRSAPTLSLIIAVFVAIALSGCDAKKEDSKNEKSAAALADPKISPLGPSDIDPADPFKGLDENNEDDYGKFFAIEDSFHKLEKPLTLGALELVAWMERPTETSEKNPKQRIELFLRNKKTSEEGWLSLIKGERYEGITFAQLEYHSGFFPEVDGELRKLGVTKTLSLGIASGKPNNFVILRTFNGRMMEVFFWAKPASATQVRPSAEENGEHLLSPDKQGTK